MCHAVTLSARTVGVSLPGICRYTSTGRTSAVGLGCTVAGQWHTRLQRGRLQALLWLAKRSISDSSLGRPDDDIYREECLRRTDLLLCGEGLRQYRHGKRVLRRDKRDTPDEHARGGHNSPTADAGRVRG